MEIEGHAVTVNRVPRQKAPGYQIGTYTEAMQKQLLDEYERKYPPYERTSTLAGSEKFVAPEGYADNFDHFKNFFASVRTRKQPVEDAVFGFRAAGAALLGNLSIERSQVVKWDPEAMKVV